MTQEQKRILAESLSEMEAALPPKPSSIVKIPYHQFCHWIWSLRLAAGEQPRPCGEKEIKG